MRKGKMSRGKAAADGSTFINQNGYHHTRVEGQWVSTHRLLAEEKLGRKLGPDEFASFLDGDRTNLTPENIIVKKRGQTSLRRRRAQLVARIEELQAELEIIDAELKVQEGS
jgi:hypothetical protein